MPAPTRRSFLAASAAAVAALAARRLTACQPTPDPRDDPMGTTEFGLDLYRQLRRTPGNVFASPFSISTALAMTAAGARGRTRDEMLQVLHLPADPANADAGFKSLLDRLNRSNVVERLWGFTLATANAVWAQKGYPWRPEFVARLSGHYGAGVIDADFRADPQAVRRRINAWVEKETHDKIKDLVKPGDVLPTTRMVLANAIYFKGDWKEKFDPKHTRRQPFHRADGSKADVQLMHRSGEYRYHEGDDLQALELPYKGDELAMAVLLPRQPDGMPALEEKLSVSALTGWLGKLRPTDHVQVYLPRFKLEAEYRLADTLKEMGMRSAFGDADFSGMHSGPEPLNISEVIHKSFADVNEEGTEAAAATAVVMRAAGLPRQTVFRADRPFLFLIRHRPTNAVLFLGRYEKP